MKKKLLQRCLLGAPLGVTIGYLITVAISLTIGDGLYHPVVPQLAQDFGSELSAVVAQTLCCLLCGAAFAGASLIWEMDGWSLLRMTIVHFAVSSAAMFPIAYLMRWMDHSAGGVLTYFAIFAGLYIAIWIGQYGEIRRHVRMMNEKLRK